MMHISLGCCKLIQAVNLLCLGQRSQSYHVTDLCLSSGEHSGTMHTRNDIYLSCQRTDLLDGTSVGTFVIFQDHLTNGLLLVLIQSLIQLAQPLFVLSEGFCHFFTDNFDVAFSGLLVIGKNSSLHLFRRNDLLHGCKQFFRNSKALILMFRLAALSNDTVEEFNDLLVYFMSFINSLDHLVVRHFIGTGFDHDNFLSGGSYSQLQVRNHTLCHSRVHDQLAIDHTHLCSRTRTIKGDIGNTGSDGRTQPCRNLRIAVRVHTHDQIVQGYVISVILREQRSHGTVNNTGSQCGMLAGFALTFVESSRDLAYSIHLFFVIHAQREEVNTLTRFVRCSCGR